jgi:hypothetical protein
VIADVAVRVGQRRGRVVDDAVEVQQDVVGGRKSYTTRSYGSQGWTNSCDRRVAKEISKQATYP